METLKLESFSKYDSYDLGDKLTRSKIALEKIYKI